MSPCSMPHRRARQFVLLVPDGAADVFRSSGLSPLGLAHTPAADLVARLGVSGLMQTFYPDLPRESMVAQLGMLGWCPRRHYPHGRASCELLALAGTYLGDRDLAFRANLVRMRGRVLESYSAGCVESPAARPLIARLARELAGDFPDFELFHNSDFRNTLVIRNAGIEPGQLVCPEPHEHQGSEFQLRELVTGKTAAAARLALRINAYLVRAARLLAAEAANALFPWSASRAFRLPSFAEHRGFDGRAAIVGFMDFLAGIASAGGIDFVRVGNGRPSTDFQAKGAATVRLLSAGYDFVLCHVNAPDEASHMGDLRLKVRCLAAFDREVVRPVVEWFQQRPERLGGVMIAPDHYTNHEAAGGRALAHSLHPVPFTLWNGRDRDEVTAFSEDAARAGDLAATPVSHLELLTLLGVGTEATAAQRRARP